MRTMKIADLSEEQIEHVVARAAQCTGEDLGYVRRGPEGDAGDWWRCDAPRALRQPARRGFAIMSIGGSMGDAGSVPDVQVLAEAIAAFGHPLDVFASRILVRDTAEVERWLNGKPMPWMVRERCEVVANETGVSASTQFAGGWWDSLYYAPSGTVIYMERIR